MPRITKVTVENDHTLHVWFLAGEDGLFDAAPYLEGPVFEPLRDENFFRQVKIDEVAGTIYWPNGADFCPDVVYEQAIALHTPQ